MAAKLVSVVVALAIMGCGQHPQTTAPTTPPATLTPDKAKSPPSDKPKDKPTPEYGGKVSVAELIAAFKDKRHADYLGKVYTVTGTVTQVTPVPTKLPLGKRPDPFVQLGTGEKFLWLGKTETWVFDHLECSFPPEVVAQMDKLKEGDRATLTLLVSKTTKYGFSCVVRP